jgi:hypothetical protein
MKNLIKKMLDEALVLKADKEKGMLVVQSNETDTKKASQETFRNKEALKSSGFKWGPTVNYDAPVWVTDMANFEEAKKTLDSINKSSEFVGKIEDLEEFVSNSEDFKGKGNLMDKINMYVQDLANATDEKAMTAEIKRYLSFFAGFRGYSFNNTLLIWIQKPNATKVAGFKKWEEKFRRVKKGAKGIMIFAGVPRGGGKSKEEAIDDSGLDSAIESGRSMRFFPVYVFDISDTEPIDERGDVPETPKWFEESEPTERTKELYSYLSEILDNMGVNLTKGDAKGGEKGYSAGNHINMSSSVEGAGEVSTLVHELAHELMHWKKSSIYYQGDEVKYNSAIKELQAESVAYIVMKHYDLPVQHQPTYLALWKANKEKILENIKVISNVAKFIIDEIDKVAAQNLKNSEELDEDFYL